MKSRKVYVALILVLILVMGVSKYLMLDFLGGVTMKLFDTFDFPYQTIIEFLNIKNSYLKDSWSQAKLGIFIYYPFYLILHVIFIVLLFDNIKVRIALILLIVMITAGLSVSRIIFMHLELNNLVYLTRRFFNTLFGLPFILLTIEGGRILYRDINRRINEINQ